MLSKFKLIWIASLIAVILTITLSKNAHAQVGDIAICNAVVGSTTHDTPLSANVETAQGFTLLTTTTVSGIKLPLQRIGSPAGTVTVRITAVTTNSGGIVVPDIPTAVYFTESYSKLTFPVASGTSTDQTVTCTDTSGDTTGTVLEFTTPIALSGGSYAIVVDASSTPGDMQWGITPASPTYAGGICSNNSNSANEGIPDDWLGCYGGLTDSGFVVFSNVITPVENDIDSWLDNFLTGLNLNTPFGRLLAGFLFATVLFFILSALRIPWIMSLGVAGLSGTFLTAATIFDPAILLGMIAIVGLGAMGLLFALFIGGGSND